MPRKLINDVHITIRIPHQLDAKVRAFAKSRDKTLSAAIAYLLWSGLSQWAEIDARKKPDDDLTQG